VPTFVPSRAKTDRPELMRLLDNARRGDMVIVRKMDRLGRPLLRPTETVNLLSERGVQLKSLTEKLIDTTSPSGKLVFGMVGRMAGLECDMLRQITNAGLAATRQSGRFGGGPKSISAVATKRRASCWRRATTPRPRLPPSLACRGIRSGGH